MSNRNFNRTYTLRFGQKGSGGRIIGERNELRISFDVEKSDSKTSNTAKLSIWNLSDESIKLLESKDCVVELKAGYDGNNALIFVGNVTELSTSFDDADHETEIEASDSRTALRDANISISYAQPVSSKELYTTIANKMGVSVVFSESFKEITLDKYVYVGACKNALTQIATRCGNAWTMQNGVMQVTMPNEPVTMKGYILSKDTGLIKAPKKVKLSSDNNKEKNLSGWEVEYFLNGAIGVNDVVVLDTKNVSGYYRVKKVKMSGDNMSGDWICKATLLEIKSTSI